MQFCPPTSVSRKPQYEVSNAQPTTFLPLHFLRTEARGIKQRVAVKIRYFLRWLYIQMRVTPLIKRATAIRGGGNYSMYNRAHTRIRSRKHSQTWTLSRSFMFSRSMVVLFVLCVHQALNIVYFLAQPMGSKFGRAIFSTWTTFSGFLFISSRDFTIWL